MIDLKLRDDPDVVRRSQRSRGEDPALVDALLEADVTRRAAISIADTLRAEQKAASRRSAPPLRRTARHFCRTPRNWRPRSGGGGGSSAETAFTSAHMAISNIVIDGCPPAVRDDFVVLDVVGTPPAIETPGTTSNSPRPWGLVDMERGAKVSGSRFYFLTGRGALPTGPAATCGATGPTEEGFTLMIPPVLVRPEIMAGPIPRVSCRRGVPHRIRRPVSGRNVRSSAGGLPLRRDTRPVRTGLRYAGWSSCFRREAGSYGKDTRGVIRVHQFDKVEAFRLLPPEDAEDEHRRLLGWQRRMLESIDVPYRVIDVAAGDLSSSARGSSTARPGFPPGTYRELTSTSNCTTFQARRLATRYRDENGKPQTAPPSTERWRPLDGWWPFWRTTSRPTAVSAYRTPGALRGNGGAAVIDIELDDMRDWFGMGVAGNFAGHLEQAGEAVISSMSSHASPPQGHLPLVRAGP